MMYTRAVGHMPVNVIRYRQCTSHVNDHKPNKNNHFKLYK